MLRRLIKFIFQLVAVAILLLLGIAAWIVFDGLNDKGQKADCALVVGDEEGAPSNPEPRLDRVVQLYNSGEFPLVLTNSNGAVFPGRGYESTSGAKYLVSHGMPPGAIIETHGDNTVTMAHDVAKVMKSRGFSSVMIVADYYRMTRLELVLNHEGVTDVEKSHVGKLQKEDALNIGREVVAVCDYVGHVYLLPAAEKAKEEAQVGLDKASVEAQKAKDKVNKSLDDMAK